MALLQCHVLNARIFIVVTRLRCEFSHLSLFTLAFHPSRKMASSVNGTFPPNPSATPKLVAASTWPESLSSIKIDGLRICCLGAGVFRHICSFLGSLLFQLPF